MKLIPKVFGVAIFATLFLILSCAPSGELGPEEGTSGIQTDESKATPPPTQPPPTQPPPVEPPPAEPPPASPPPAQPTGEFTEGTIRTFFGDGSPAVIEFPNALAMDSNDNLFVSAQRRIPDPNAFGGIGTIGGVFKITPAKEISLVPLRGFGGGITDLALDPQGNLFILEDRFPDQFQSPNISALYKFSPTGTQTLLADNLTHPRGLLVMGDGRIIVAESDTNRVVELPSTPGGAFKLIAGKRFLTVPPAGFLGDGGPATEARLSGPTGLGIDSSGRIFICDHLSATEGGHRVRVVGTDGIINTAATLSCSSILGKNNNLRIPLVVVGEGSVLDLDGNRIAGNGTLGFSGDGGPAENAQLDKPSGLAMDSKGFLYISDFGNNRIRIVNPKRGTGTPFIQ